MGTVNVTTGGPVPWPDAVRAWVDEGQLVLAGCARRYGSLITYGELAEEIQTNTGIRTTSLLQNWIGEVLAKIHDEQPSTEPALTAFVIDAHGYTGKGYADAIKRRDGAPPANLEEHAAHERLRCHRHFEAPDLPTDGGIAQYPPGVVQERRQARQEAQNAARQETCPEHGLRLTMAGTCDMCPSPRGSGMPDILAIEGAWDDGLAYLESVRHTVELLGSATEITFMHRHAESPDMLKALLDLWVTHHAESHVGFLAFHGVQGKLQFQGDEEMTLEELGEHLDGRVDGGAIHLGGCSVLRLGDERIQQFRKTAGASIITGYRKDVDWLEAAVFDALVLSHLAQMTPGRAKNALVKKYPDFIERLGFVAYR